MIASSLSHAQELNISFASYTPNEVIKGSSVPLFNHISNYRQAITSLKSRHLLYLSQILSEDGSCIPEWKIFNQIHKYRGGPTPIWYKDLVTKLCPNLPSQQIIELDDLFHSTIPKKEIVAINPRSIYTKDWIASKLDNNSIIYGRC